jgi:hypothetical protein
LLRIAAAFLLWSLAFAAALVAAQYYWLPIAVSLLSACGYAWLVLPLWTAGKWRIAIAAASTVLAALCVNTLARLAVLIMTV